MYTIYMNILCSPSRIAQVAQTDSFIIICMLQSSLDCSDVIINALWVNFVNRKATMWKLQTAARRQVKITPKTNKLHYITSRIIVVRGIEGETFYFHSTAYEFTN